MAAAAAAAPAAPAAAPVETPVWLPATGNQALTGCVRVLFHRAEGVLAVDRTSKKCDPYIKCHLEGGVFPGVGSGKRKAYWKSSVKKKTLAPVWTPSASASGAGAAGAAAAAAEETGQAATGPREEAFFWALTETPVVRIELWDNERFGKNRMIGMGRVAFASGAAQTGEVAVEMAPVGKFAKKVPEGGNAGVVFVSLTWSMTKDVTTPYWQMTEFPDGAFIMLDQDVAGGFVELQGAISDVTLLQVVSGLISESLPMRDLDRDGSLRAWRIPYGKGTGYGGYAGGTQYTTRVSVGQNMLLHLMDRLALCGFRLLRAAPSFMVPNGDNGQIKSMRHDLVMQKLAPTMAPTDPAAPKHLLVDPTYSMSKPHYRIEIQGHMPAGAHAVLCTEPWELLQTPYPDDPTKSSVLAYMISVPNMSGFLVTGAQFKRVENQWQSFVLNVLDILQWNGARHVTSHGSGHIFTYAPGIPPNPRTHAMVDVGYFGHFVLELQGNLSEDEAGRCAAAVGVKEMKVLTNKKDGALRAYSIKLNASASSMSVSGMTKNMSRVQNAMLKALDQLTAMGFVLLTANDVDDLIVARDPALAAAMGPTLLVEAAYQHGLKIEVQGDISQEQLMAAASTQGLTEMLRVDDDKNGGVLAYQFKVPGSMPSGFSISGLRKAQNRCQGLQLALCEALSQYSYIAVLPHGLNGPLLLRQVAGIQAGQYALVDFTLGGSTGYVMEIQGPSLMGHEADLARACQAVGLPSLERTTDKDGSLLCYSISLSIGVNYYSVSAARKAENIKQNSMLRAFRALASMGFMMLCPVGEGHLFYRPTGAPAQGFTSGLQPVNYLPLVDPRFFCPQDIAAGAAASAATGATLAVAAGPAPGAPVPAPAPAPAMAAPPMAAAAPMDPAMMQQQQQQAPPPMAAAPMDPAMMQQQQQQAPPPMAAAAPVDPAMMQQQQQPQPGAAPPPGP